MLEATKSALSDFKYILATVLVLFFVGAKDDIIGTAPIKRLAAHIVVALMIVLMANIRIKSMHGIFDIYEIQFWSSIFLSLFSIIVIINAPTIKAQIILLLKYTFNITYLNKL